MLPESWTLYSEAPSAAISAAISSGLVACSQAPRGTIRKSAHGSLLHAAVPNFIQCDVSLEGHQSHHQRWNQVQKPLVQEQKALDHLGLVWLGFSLAVPP